MSNSKIAAVAYLLWMHLVSLALCADMKSAGTEDPEQAKQVEPTKELERTEIVERLKNNLDSFPEIFNFVPGIKKETTQEGKAVYSYRDKKFEDLSKEDLDQLYSRVGSETARMRTDRFNRQLETIRRTERLNKQNRQLKQIRNYQQPPIPRAMPRPPKIPKPPPASTKR
jgi:hypothetical protein